MSDVGSDVGSADQGSDRRPLYSIIVPAFNEGTFLGDTLDSLQHQDFAGPYEIVVVDNNSTDDTAAVAAAHGVRVVTETVQGTCAARQRGADEARGDVFVSVDADTSYPPDWLRTLDEGFTSDEVVAVGGPCRYDSDVWWVNAFTTALFGVVAVLFALVGAVVYVSATNLAVRRSAFPGYDRNLSQGGDELDLLRRVRRRGRVVWTRSNVVTTSPRRVERGLFYTLFVALAYHYLLTYLVNRVTGRGSLGMAPSFRQRTAPTWRRLAARRPIVAASLARSEHPRRWLAVAAVAVVLAVVEGPASAGRLMTLWHHR